VLTRPIVLKPKKRQPVSPGPVVRVETVRCTGTVTGTGPAMLVNGTGLRDWDNDGLKQHSTNPARMWQTVWTNNLALEFTLPEPVTLSAIEVWNFNVPWQTTNGVRHVDVAVSADGNSWRTVLEKAGISEAEGTDDYDEPTVLALGGVKAHKVRLENFVPMNPDGKIGLSEVVFRQQPGDGALPVQPEDGACAVPANNVRLVWTTVTNASTYRVYLGSNATALKLLLATNGSTITVPALTPGTTYFWRVDTVPTAGRVVRGRVAKFTTGGLVGWWQFDKRTGTQIADASGHGTIALVRGEPKLTETWPNLGGALELDGAESFVECADSPLFDFGEGMTVAFWIKVRQLEWPDQVFIAKGTNGWRVSRFQTDGRVAFYPAGPKPADGASLRLVSKRVIDDGQWHHVVGTYDGQKAALYIDGELECAAAATGLIAPSAGPVLIGKGRSRFTPCFNGWMADVRLYSCGLTAQEVQALYNELKR